MLESKGDRNSEIVMEGEQLRERERESKKETEIGSVREKERQ